MRVTAIVAHCDDEVLGVGGTLARHVNEGDEVQVVVVCTNSFRGHDVDPSLQLAASMKALGVARYSWLKYADQKLEQVSFEELVNAIQRETGDLHSVVDLHGIVYTHWYKDLNRDHRIVNEAVQILTRPKHGYKLEIREFPTPSSTEYSREVFTPNLWVDISGTLDQKIWALYAYSMELQSLVLYRNGQGLKDLAATLGRQVGLSAVEVFDVVRRIV